MVQIESKLILLIIISVLYYKFKSQYLEFYNIFKTYFLKNYFFIYNIKYLIFLIVYASKCDL